jgi:hypothetical protein
LIDELDDDDLPGGGRRVVESLRPTPLTDKEKAQVKKRLQRLVGNVGLKWDSEVIDAALKLGPNVAGRTAVSGF